MNEDDYGDWYEVRARCRDWLVPWEPRPEGSPTTPEDRASFVARCAARERERQMGTGYGFGIFVEARLAGEITLSSIQRGPFQNGFIGYWVDRALAGAGLAPEATVAVLRGVEKLELREEGVALRYLEIDGRWEDHVRYAITSEEWAVRQGELVAGWTSPG
jgi:ribosomal-protein-alanine N-acetyltransferase